MTNKIISTGFSSLGAGFLFQILQACLNTDFLNIWLQLNLIQLQIALLAINAATLGVILTKIRDLIEKSQAGRGFFQSTKKQILLSLKEQISLICLAILLLTVWSSPVAKEYIPYIDLTFGSLVSGVFIYSLKILYDTVKSVIVIVDYDPAPPKD
ncbi:hypothetical protein [Paenalcaligenes suwonensis]|uniref:hypothetical protein n=1 Tax=Paenalcaligenes suwonensis TaxID=1202713 RepID=UPI00140AD8AB|nr:hypothetical protein [Paenalcaligenes suwonensis]NHC63075.1 hypothetical protein [Paenalcaligenes suwonensis]